MTENELYKYENIIGISIVLCMFSDMKIIGTQLCVQFALDIHHTLYSCL